jgi:hypothetical protein
MGRMRNANKILFGNPERNTSFRTLRCGMEDNINMGFSEISLEDVDWINLAQDRGRLRILVNTVINLLSSLKSRQFCDYLSVLSVSEDGCASCSELVIINTIFGSAM